MDMRQLEVFCRVVELHSFTRAAEAVFLSQPTVSEHIRTLEETLGEKLLDRLGREVLPTPAGRILYRYAHRILQTREEAIQAMARYRGELTGRLVLGASTIPGTYMLPKIIGGFKTRHPSIQLALKILGSGQIVEAVLRGDLEIGLVGAKWKDRRLKAEEIFSEELVLTVYPEHPWTDREEVGMEEIYGEPFILREQDSGTRKVMSEILEAHGFDMSKLSVVAEMATTQAVCQSIKARIGISIVSRQAVEEDLERGSLAAVTLRGIRFSRPFYLIQRVGRQLSPLCEAFLAYMRMESRS
ncbi:MAG: LysR family transcriptional regulator [Deltaproteobacteria bacterium]|nr:LysR family transcriptional regulator [Deltaproteobacteria bacterium]MBW2122678.1 LysR family transcriptional regulator [Deltaproteobacteria bacterium]